MSTQPPWGTPPPSPASPTPTSTGYLATRSGRRGERAAGGVLALVVEQQTGSGESMVWRVDPEPMLLPAGSTPDQADQAALDLAHTFEPHHPWSKGERSIFRLAPGSYLVLVEGATRMFHFRVSVAELVG